MAPRVCDTCRDPADGSPTLRCTAKRCSRFVHIECALPGTDKSTFVCPSCEHGGGERVKQGNGGKVAQRHYDLWQRQARWIAANAEAIEPFVSDDRWWTLQEYTKERTSPAYCNDFPKAPFYVKATCRDYQVEGVRWMLSNYEHGFGGVLADEMGLGKTIQTLSFFAHLKENGTKGPHLVVVPLSVLQNWANEAKRFTPSLKILKISGGQAERARVLSDPEVMRGDVYDVYITNYEVIPSEERFFIDQIRWQTVVIDEGQRLKNATCQLAKILASISCPFRLLLTGTPIQNNLTELWALLHFVLPKTFGKSADKFASAWDVEDGKGSADGGKALVLMRNLLDSVMLRRIKADVEKSLLPKVESVIYAPLSPLQTEWYNRLLNPSSLSGLRDLLQHRLLLRMFHQIRKVCNGGPKQILLTFEEQKAAARRSAINAMGAEFVKIEAEPSLGPDGARLEAELRALAGDSLVSSSAKLLLLRELLEAVRAQGSRVLLFSQYTQTLDVVQEMLTALYGAEAILRLDGSTNRLDREMDVRSFNAPGSIHFVYLISTRAGGVGINLATADVVVMFDSCPNPQVDNQAIARSHRIGQTKQVRVFRLVTEATAEERAIDWARRKLFLEAVVVAGEGGKGGDDDDDLAGLTVSAMWEMVMGAKAGDLPSNYQGVDMSRQELRALVDRACAWNGPGETAIRSGRAPTLLLRPPAEEKGAGGESTVQRGRGRPSKAAAAVAAPRGGTAAEVGEVAEEAAAAAAHEAKLVEYEAKVAARKAWALNLVGCEVKKRFDNPDTGRAQVYSGSVTAYETAVRHRGGHEEAWTVTYEDGDMEDMGLVELRATLVAKPGPRPAAPSRPPPRERRAPRAAPPVQGKAANAASTPPAPEDELRNMGVKGLKNMGVKGLKNMGVKGLKNMGVKGLKALLSEDELRNMGVKGLKALLAARGVDYSKTVEKSDLVKLALGSATLPAATVPSDGRSEEVLAEGGGGAGSGGGGGAAGRAPIEISSDSEDGGAGSGGGGGGAGLKRKRGRPVGTGKSTSIKPNFTSPSKASKFTGGPEEEEEEVVMGGLVAGRKTRAKREPRRYEPVEYRGLRPQQKRVPIHHHSACAECTDGGSLILCDFCPKAFHLECLSMDSNPKGSFKCPWHFCWTCERTAANSGGKLFHCRGCAHATCFDCAPDHIVEKSDPLAAAARDQFAARGTQMLDSMSFILCDDCRTQGMRVDILKKGGGRPPGVPNKPKAPQPKLTAASWAALAASQAKAASWASKADALAGGGAAQAGAGGAEAACPTGPHVHPVGAPVQGMDWVPAPGGFVWAPVGAPAPVPPPPPPHALVEHFYPTD